MPIADAARDLVTGGYLPQATYVLPDGTAMVPADHQALLEHAGGDPEAIGPLFRTRFLAPPAATLPPWTRNTRRG